MSSLENRDCPVCNSMSFELLYKQEFSNLLGISLNTYAQNIVICKKCGMIYTNPFLTDEMLNYYYTNMSNYEYDDNENEYPEADKRRSLNQFKYIKDYYTSLSNKSILDIGCALGYTISLFKDNGCDVIGLEPSIKNKKIAKEKYGVDIESRFLDKDGLEGREFDVVILSHVSEHLKYPLEIFRNIRDVLSDSGILYIETPDIDLFDEQDLYQFSFEHINYFNIDSTKNLLYQAGFELVDFKIFFNDKNTAPFYPTLGTIWKKSNKKFKLENYYEKNKKTIQEYIDLVNSFRSGIVNKIDNIIYTHKNIAIWAAGTLTSQLMSQTNLLKGDLVAIFDNDSKKEGLQMQGIKIYKPVMNLEYFKEKNIEVIIIGSWSSQSEISRSLEFLKSNIEVIELF